MSISHVRQMLDQLQELNHTLRPEIEATLQKIQDWSLKNNDNLVNAAGFDDPGILNPYMTERQKYMKLYWDMFGYLGLHFYIYQIAIWEAHDDAGQGVGDYRRPAKPKPACHRDDDLYSGAESSLFNSQTEDSQGNVYIQVPDSQETSQDSQPRGLQGWFGESNAAEAGHISWQRLILDYEKGPQSRCLYYLLSLHPLLIEGLIAGDLPHRMEEPRFNRKVKPFTDTQPGHGTYAVFVALENQHRGVPALSQTPEPELLRGRGLTFADLIKVIDKMKLYLDLGNPESEILAIKIDNAFPGCPEVLKYRVQRRYAGKSDHTYLDKHKTWVHLIEGYLVDKARQLLGTPDEWKLEEYMIRCFLYVGLSTMVCNRSSNHWGHGRTTSPLFGLFTATVKYLFKEKYAVKPFTYQILRTAKEEDVGLDEILTTVLCSGYLWDVGLNFTHAGGREIPEVSADPGNFFIKNASWIKQQGLQAKNLETSLQKVQGLRNALERQDDEEEEQLRSQHANNLNDLSTAAEDLDLLHALTEKETVESILANYEEA